MTTHILKTHPPYFQAVLDGKKTFEVRNNDRKFHPDDILLLREYDPQGAGYTGRETSVKVVWILPGGSYGLKLGYCCMSVAPLVLKSTCMYCGQEIERTGDKLLEHIITCEKRPELKIIETASKQLTELSRVIDLLSAWAIYAHQKHDDLTLPDFVIEWQPEFQENENAETQNL